MTDQMRCDVAARDGGYVVAVEGEVDIATAPRLAETLVQFTTGSITVDLSKVTFIDASGLRALIAAQRHAGRRHGQFVLQGVNPRTCRLIEMAGLTALLLPNGCGTERGRA